MVSYKWAIFLVYLTLNTPWAGPKLKYVSAGPTLLIDFGKSKREMGIGIEVAYWEYPSQISALSQDKFVPADGKPGFGLDVGVEFFKNKTRLYSELQMGFSGMTGISFGPTYQFHSEKMLSGLGLQTSIWGNILLGVNLRVLYLKGNLLPSPGLYFKIPKEI